MNYVNKRNKNYLSKFQLNKEEALRSVRYRDELKFKNKKFHMLFHKNEIFEFDVEFKVLKKVDFKFHYEINGIQVIYYKYEY